MKINWIEEAKEYLNFLEIEDIEIKTKERLVSKIIWGMVDDLEVDDDVLTNGYIELKVKEIQQEIDRTKIELLEKIVDKKGYTDEMIINRMEREYLYLTKPIIINNPIKLEDEDKEIEIPFSMEDLEDLKEGEEFNWTFDGIDVHLYNEEVDLL